MMKICASIKMIEKGILIDIVENSTLFNTLATEESVYQKVSFEDFPIFSWSMRTREQIETRSLFISRCMNAGNKEVLYKMDFFLNNCLGLALQRLWDTKKRGHNGAAYVLAIISIFAGGNDRSDAVKESLINIIDNVWVSHPIFLTQRPDRCCTCEHESLVRVNGWPGYDELDDQHCYGCACDAEVDHVFDILSKFG
ncbi:hypothetical protein H5410_005056, partial [Solanum commersonii]